MKVNKMKGIMYTKALFPLLLFILLMLSGCAEPITSGVADIYLREALLVDFTYLYSEDTENENSEIYHYYRCENGIEFFVMTGVYSGAIDKTMNTCNYIDLLFEQQKIFEKLDSFQNNGYSFDRESSNGLANINISDYADIELAADLLFAFIDTLDFIPINKEAYERHFTRIGNLSDFTYIAFMCNKNEYKGQLITLSLPMGNDTFINKSDLIRRLEDALAEDSKLQFLDFGVPMSIMSRDPSPRIDRIMLDGEVFESLCIFNWDDARQDYYAHALNILNWSKEGVKRTFGEFVNCLGGTFTTDGRHSEWVIGENTWEADIVTIENEDGMETFLTFSKNGEDLLLDKDLRDSYTMSDLEQLLSVEIEWENHEAIAYIVR